MSEFSKIEKILRQVKAKIEAHNEFKNAYNKQLAFDFSLFDFFKVGENKVSEILAFLLDENQSHGQGNIFLNEFINLFYGQELDMANSQIICEKTITDKRRIDIYIKLKNKIIAIENKIWADDQHYQLRDYATYLEKKSKGNYLLLYLNPYGSEPTDKSIEDKFKEELIKADKFKIISYKHDIIGLINKWLMICEADNVSHFIKEFKKFLEVKFLGNKTLNMSENLRKIIYNNHEEVLSLVEEYKTIENEVIDKLNIVGKELENVKPKVDSDVTISKSGLFNWYGTRVYKYSLSKGENKIWIQYVKKDIYLLSNYYFQEGTHSEFIQLGKSSSLNNHEVVNYKLNKRELMKLFLEQVEIANGIFRKFDEFMVQNE